MDCSPILNTYLLRGATEDDTNALNRLLNWHRRRHLQPQPSGNVVDAGRVQGNAPVIYRRDQIHGALLVGSQGIARGQQRLEPGWLYEALSALNAGSFSTVATTFAHQQSVR